MGFALLCLILSFLLLLINPIIDLFASSKPSPSTQPPSAVAVFHAQATSDAFSDEEQDCTVSTTSHESDLAVPLLRDSDVGVHDSDSPDPDSSRTRSDTPPTRTPHRSKVLARTPGATTPGKRPLFIKTDMDLSSILINFNLHPLYPGKRLIFTDMDREDKSPKPEPSRDYKDAQPSNDSDAMFKSHPSNDRSARLKTGPSVWTGICGKTPVLCLYFCDFARLSVM